MAMDMSIYSLLAFPGCLLYRQSDNRCFGIVVYSHPHGVITLKGIQPFMDGTEFQTNMSEDTLQLEYLAIRNHEDWLVSMATCIAPGFDKKHSCT